MVKLEIFSSDPRCHGCVIGGDLENLLDVLRETRMV